MQWIVLSIIRLPVWESGGFFYFITNWWLFCLAVSLFPTTCPEACGLHFVSKCSRPTMFSLNAVALLRPYRVSTLSQSSAGWVRPEYSRNACCGCCCIEVRFEVFLFSNRFSVKRQLGQVQSESGSGVRGNSAALGVWAAKRWWCFWQQQGIGLPR